jgi:hypothetical protein
MNREVTMQSVFFAGFKSGYLGFQLNEGDPNPTAESTWYFNDRNSAWLDFVKQLEADNAGR